MELKFTYNSRNFALLNPKRVERVMSTVLRRAGATALRDMRSEITKRVRKRKRLKVKAVRNALDLSKPSKGHETRGEWRIDVSGKPVPLSAYPHRQIKKGVSVSVNKGKRTVVKHAFVATMASGHKGVFERKTKKRLPIKERLGSRPVDALKHHGEIKGVTKRGQKSFRATIKRLMAKELTKGKKRR